MGPKASSHPNFRQNTSVLIPSSPAGKSRSVTEQRKSCHVQDLTSASRKRLQERNQNFSIFIPSVYISVH
ncbi:hypothetical protein GDO81_026306 [Engystomops pustulosus]|uniref:Uncharacterized protein n=1 Tax=Engystomops pustulosus TaxID=76066 RepID=A0AAV6YHG7_ENGPU|nr:hypothetical protein GDO81_026306 [Engystomops pustulosus]